MLLKMFVNGVESDIPIFLFKIVKDVEELDDKLYRLLIFARFNVNLIIINVL